MKKVFYLCSFIIVMSIFGVYILPTALDQLKFNATALIDSPVNAQPVKLVFDDEFKGKTLNLQKWQTQLMWGRTNPPELQYYLPNAFTLTNGLLRINANKKLTYGKSYYSGVITTYKSFRFTYGTVIARIRVPYGKGLWPALWLLDYAGGTNEIDITEILGHQPNISYMTLHYPWSTAGGYYIGPNFSKNFHTFRLDWTPTAIVWSIDGVQHLRLTQHIPSKPMYLIANLAVGGDWPGPPNSTTRFPAYYYIDYIRIYK